RTNRPSFASAPTAARRRRWRGTAVMSYTRAQLPRRRGPALWSSDNQSAGPTPSKENPIA
ncbi:hypothetical protein, partial [Mycobacteroides abscessus]|uniref:hypothetical protein n=1 Tax=Mycobacteroides abscessus TaxID=36809 RepID=UPI001A979072